MAGLTPDTLDYDATVGVGQEPPLSTVNDDLDVYNYEEYHEAILEPLTTLDYILMSLR